MIKLENKKKGFVLAETLVIIIFILIIFTLLYNNITPLLGQYKEISYYDDLDTTYNVYQYKKIIESDSNYVNILNNDYYIINCSDLTNQTTCNNLNSILDFKEDDTLMFLKTKTETYKNDSNISDEIKKYLEYLTFKEDENILLLEHDGYISYITLSDTPKEFTSDYIKILTERKNKTCKTYVLEDGITYISGKNTCINFNYVWWSGKMWRITAIYPDGSIKMITDKNITNISFNYSKNSTYYDKETGTKSFVFQFLNEDFLDTLYNKGEDVIDYTKYWNTTMQSNQDISTKLVEEEETLIPTTISPIGLLNSYEYYKSYQNTYNVADGYLNRFTYWWLINRYSQEQPWDVIYDGNSNNSSTVNSFGIRPTIIIKPGIIFSGQGTYENPLTISYDYPKATQNDLLNSRYSGEYVKFDLDNTNTIYRIVSIENNSSKILSLKYATYDETNAETGETKTSTLKKFGLTNADITYGLGTTNDTWDYYLNNDWYNNLPFKNKLVMGTFYIGKISAGNLIYKLGICKRESIDTTKNCLTDETKRVETTFTGYVGLLRYGEMFATHLHQERNNSNTNKNTYLLTKYNTNCLALTNLGNIFISSSTELYNVQPVYYLNSNVKILSGSGTELDPYIIS